MVIIINDMISFIGPALFLRFPFFDARTVLGQKKNNNHKKTNKIGFQNFVKTKIFGHVSAVSFMTSMW